MPTSPHRYSVIMPDTPPSHIIIITTGKPTLLYWELDLSTLDTRRSPPALSMGDLEDQKEAPVTIMPFGSAGAIPKYYSPDNANRMKTVINHYDISNIYRVQGNQSLCKYSLTRKEQAYHCFRFCYFSYLCHSSSEDKTLGV